MPTPRMLPDRVQTAAERQARRRELLLHRLALAAAALVLIAEKARTLEEARTLAREALADAQR